jgi:NarL family two-component system sensor histidine kinase YdfH
MQYALAQGGLGIALTFATGNPSVWGVTFTWLVCEAAGLLDRPHLTAVSLVLYGLFGVAALLAIADPATALSWLGAILPTMLFVGVVVVIYKRQAEARAQAQRLVEDLEQANRQVAAYAERVEQLTLVNERQRMARELHDTLSQDVAALVLQLEAANAHLEAGRETRAKEIVQQAMSRARSTLHAARAAIDDLRARDRPAPLRERLLALCRRFEAENEVLCTFTSDRERWDSALAPQLQEHLERFVSEALSNAAKHARANHVEVDIGVDTGRLILRVVDDGIGFDPSAVPEAGHYGLRGLRERARLLGGTVEISAAPGAGTAVGLQIPLESFVQIGGTTPQHGGKPDERLDSRPDH